MANFSEPDPQQTAEWLDAFDELVRQYGAEAASHLLDRLLARAQQRGVQIRPQLCTPYVNTIPAEQELPYPGDRDLERRIKSLVRWNAMAMVVRANRYDPGIGGHVSTYASLATLLEVGFNHFFRASYGDQPGDFVYFQGHAAPGVYARAFLEGRLTREQLVNFRHELRGQPGLTSYPHPWLMPGFWQFPTVSMGLAPINAIYQARFLRYLENRGLLPATPRKVWAFLGDGEMDEPESVAGLRLAAFEKLDNLIFVVNCNLQRLDGPVRGNGKIIQELEALFRGAGWNVIKVIWGSNWDPLLERDKTGLLVQRMNECLDGDYQNYVVRKGDYIRRHFFGKYPELLDLVKDLSDEDLWKLRRGGHDPQKVYNAYQRAIEHTGSPTVILAKTVKGYGLGEAGEGRNITHQQKKLNEEELEQFRRRFEIPIPPEAVHSACFYRPPEDSAEIRYIRERRQALGGYLPERKPRPVSMVAPPLDYFAEILGGSGAREVSTTMAFVRLLTLLLRHAQWGRFVVPIIPDEARTFGMEALFRQVGIYASRGQLYEPVDHEMFLYYREARDGQLLEEGISEAGAMASFTAAGTAWANLGLPMVPFYIYYSMFGFQRVGDLMWAFADARGKGFLLGATAGRTTLAGEGLQHQDGHSQLLMSVIPTCAVYDPAYAYEIAVIVQDGLRRMYQQGEDRFYYLALYNENYAQPPMPEGVAEGILRGIYLCQPTEGGQAQVELLGSGPILREALRARTILAERYAVRARVWSVTSYTELRREALSVERWNRLHPEEPPRQPYLLQVLGSSQTPIVAATDYIKAVPDQIAPWLAGRLVSLGTDGFGRSDNRSHLRNFFGVSAEAIAAAALAALARQRRLPPEHAARAVRELGLDPDAPDPAHT